MKFTWKEFNTISNYLSVSRFVLIIPIIFLLDEIQTEYSYRLIIFGLMILSAITDVLDGYFARKFNQVTEIGKVIDPLADKISYAIIVFKLYTINAIPDYFFWMIIIRDIYIFTGGLLVSKKIGKVLPSNLLGKITVIFIGFYFVLVVLDVNPNSLIYLAMLYTSILFIVISAIGYTIRGIESIRYYKNGTF